MNLDKPVMLYDGYCEFCCRWVLRWEKITGDCVKYRPYQDVLGKFPQLSEVDCIEAVQLVDVDGKVYSGGEAVLKTLAYNSQWKWLYSYYKKNRFFARMAEGFYRWVARNRG